MSYLSAKLNYSSNRNILERLRERERERGKEKTEERQLAS